MIKEHEVFVDRVTNTLVIDGEPYVSKKVVRKKIDGVTHFPKVIYRKASKKEIDDNVKKIVNALNGKTTKEELLRELVRNELSMRKIIEINRELDKNPKIKKHKGCLGFKIGKKYVQLIG